MKGNMEMRKNLTLIRLLAAILAFILVLVGMPARTLAIVDGSTPFTVDVWTDKGGRGANVAGGSYEVGEEVTIYWKANSDCQASVIISGPTTGYPGQPIDAVLDAGATYEWSLGKAEEADVGQWQVTIDAGADEQLASDSTSFTIVAAQPPPTPLTVDVWTNKGGQGANMPGGRYKVSEEVTIYWKANRDCQASITISGPTTGYPGQLVDAVLDAGKNYEWSLGKAEEADIGQWEVTIDAGTEGGQYSSDSTSFTIVAAQPPPTPLTVDVWVNKGGQGRNMPGGTYKVGEEIVLYVEVSATCQGAWTLSGPPGTDSGEQLMDSGIYDWPLGKAEEADIGQWQMVFEAWTDGQRASDSTSFVIAGAEPEPEPIPTPPPTPTPSEPKEQPTPKVDASNATELYALMALKMSEGSMPVDLNLDADGDGQVTRQDACLILKWAVKGR